MLLEIAGPFYAPPDHKMLWFGVPGEVASGPGFHQVTEKEGCVRLRVVYILGLYRKSGARLL